MVSTIRCWVISFTLRVFGTDTSMPDCSTGAVTMKMMSRTRTTSTSGVMLISASEVRVWPELAVKATCGLPLHRVLFGLRADLFQAVEQFAREVVHARAKLAQRSGELVVGDHGRNSHQQAGGGGDQGFGNARRHGTQSGRALRAQAMKGIHDAHDRTEKTDEGRHCADGGQPGKTPFQNRERFARGRLGRALERDYVFGRSETAGLAPIRVIHLIEDADQRAGLELLADRRHLLQPAGLAEGAHEAAALRAGLAKGASLTQNNCPRV